MYSNKENVNILTALLVGHGVKHAVVCPGSRNAPLVHNLVTCPDISCYSVTDERSAGFYAMGIALAISEPVVVCVTSGTALLNLLPAVAEAYYQRVPLVVVSADRPQQWIDQLDGQTLPQADALGRFVRKAVTLPEPNDDETRWYCNRLVNEALLATVQQGGGPVHINVPMTEPLYTFTTEVLPTERVISLATARNDRRLLANISEQFLQSQKPMIVVGQTMRGRLTEDDFKGIDSWAVVLNESLSVGNGGCCFDEVLIKDNSETLQPDFVLVLGDTLVSKRLKKFLRGLSAEVSIWAVSEDGQIHDTFKNLHGVIEGRPKDVLADLKELIVKKQPESINAFKIRWGEQLKKANEVAQKYSPDYSQMAAVKLLEKQLGSAEGMDVHYGNSCAIRLANIYARHFVYCNRGVNGIEGTLSTAAGFSLVKEGLVYCVLGDLSSFYDSNGLWQRDLRRNLRILLLNNGCGGIFEKFEGLKASPARERFVMVQHQTSAEGICQSYDVNYRVARSMEELQAGIEWLTATHLSGGRAEERPLLLEVFTNSEEDSRTMEKYYELF
ncbi:MAG: 2-succinyl-5-enolpyruvyl-6-hydroxy-3-cyclohexene-1-carboxylic-acid synthase [Prevotella sp.]|nr:2-succinyl-5-enolpyruvyl-6-hydroxy-3-cyclohexene-1-carboxylic-acid synthase [Prevotella sp.]